MKKQDRARYLAVCGSDIQLPDRDTYPILCSFCKYAEWNGDCKEPENDCKHPLGVAGYYRAEQCIEDYLCDGEDCWLFSPNVTPEVAADIVGIWLQGKQVDWNTVPMIGVKK